MKFMNFYRIMQTEVELVLEFIFNFENNNLAEEIGLNQNYVLSFFCVRFAIN